MGFLDALRMNGLIDRPQGSVPIGMPNMGGDIPEGPFHMIRAALLDDEERRNQREDDLIRRHRETALMDRALSNQQPVGANLSGVGRAGVQGYTATGTDGMPMDTVLGSSTKTGGMTDYQRSTLALRGKDQSADNEIAQQRLDLSEAANAKKLDDASRIELQNKGKATLADDAQAARMEQIVAGIVGATKRNTDSIAGRAEVANTTQKGALERDVNAPPTIQNTDKGPIQWNAATKKWEKVTLGDEEIKDVAKPGSKLSGKSSPEHNQFAQDTIDTLDQILTPDGKFKPGYDTITGGSRLLQTQRIPGSMGNRTEEGTMQKFMAQNLTQLVAKLKENGANPFGILSNSDRDILQKAATGDMDLAGDESQILSRLNTIREKLKSSVSKSTDLPAGSGGGKGKPLTKTQTNTKTGQKRTLISQDGGITWNPEGTN